MDPITILYIIGLALGSASVIYIAYLSLKAVRDYIRNKRTTKAVKEASFIMKKQLESGKIRVIAGFLDGKDVKEAQIWEANEVEANIRSLPDNEITIVT